MWIIHLTLILCCSLQVFANENNKDEPTHSTDETYDEDEINPCDGYNQDQEKICQLIQRLTVGGDSTSLGAQLQQAVDNETIKCAQNLKQQRDQFVVKFELLNIALSATNLSLQGLMRREQELVGEADSAKQQAEVLQGKLKELQNKTTDDADGTTKLTEMSRLDKELAVARKKIEQLNNKINALKQEKSLLKFHFQRITARENELKLSLTQQEQERAKQLEKIETLTLELEQAQEALVMEREKFLQQHDTFTQLVENLESKHALCESSKSNATSILETERKLLSQLETSKEEVQNLLSVLDDVNTELNATNTILSSCNESHHVCITKEEKIVEKHQEALKQLQICEELRRVTTTLPPTTATPATTCRYIICKTPSCLNANATKAASLRAVPSSPRNPGSLNLITLKGRKYYLEMRNTRSWFDALAFCKSYGMQLATLETETEHNAVYTHLISLNVANFAVFTSLNRAGSRCNYPWENGASLTYTNWRPGDPWHQATEECMILTANSWADVPCDRKYRFLCEQVP